jgi:hypothetical protein
VSEANSGKNNKPNQPENRRVLKQSNDRPVKKAFLKTHDEGQSRRAAPKPAVQTKLTVTTHPAPATHSPIPNLQSPTPTRLQLALLNYYTTLEPPKSPNPNLKPQLPTPKSQPPNAQLTIDNTQLTIDNSPSSPTSLIPTSSSAPNTHHVSRFTHHASRTPHSSLLTPDPSPDLGRAIDQRRGLGSPLPTTVQTQLETGLNTPLSDVRVHTDEKADELSRNLQAKAFTTGPDIFFRKGEYNPTSRSGIQLLAHEATHVRQQRSGPVSGTPTAGGVEVSHPDDPFEREAEATANTLIQRLPTPGTTTSADPPPTPSNGNGHNSLGELVTRPAAQRQPDSLDKLPTHPTVQRCGCLTGSCSCGGHKEEDTTIQTAPAETPKSQPETPKSQIPTPNLQSPISIQNPKSPNPPIPASPSSSSLSPQPSVLDPHTRTRFEQTTGRSLDNVTVYEDDPAAIPQLAFAQRDEIHLSPNVPGPDTPLGAQVRLHEATHVAQFRLQPDHTNGANGNHDTAEWEAATVTQAALHGQKEPVQMTADGSQRHGWEWPSLDDIANMGESALASLVERISPGLAQLIREGPIGMLTEKIKDGVKSWISSISGSIDLGSIVDSVKSAFTSVLNLFDGQDDPANCGAFAQLLMKIRKLGAAFMDNPVFNAIKGVLDTVKGFFNKVKTVVLEPAFEVVKNIAGGIWDGVTAIANKIKGWFNAAKQVAGRVWNWVKGKLGISDDGPGLMDWLKEKASAAWNSVKETFAPVVGPLKTVVQVLMVINPTMWPTLAIIYLPDLLGAAEFLWANRNNPNIIRTAREQGHGNLAKLLSGGKGFADGIGNIANQIVEGIGSLSKGLLELLGGITGLPLLSAAQGLVQTVSNGAKALFEFGQNVFKAGVEKVKGVFNTIKAAVAPYMEILTSIGMCILNPGMIPMVLAGWAWRKLDDCYKEPIIDFILDILVGILKNLPTMPMLGPLWPLVKTGVIGFLEGFKAQPTAKKVAASNKLAKIVSSPSLDFITGFVKGFVTGVWEGLTDPFKLIYMVLKGLSALVSWAEGLAGGGETTTANRVQPGAAPYAAAAAPSPAANGNGQVVTGRRNGTAPSTNGTIYHPQIEAGPQLNGKSNGTGSSAAPASAPAASNGSEEVTLHKVGPSRPAPSTTPTGGNTPAVKEATQTNQPPPPPRPAESEVVTMQRNKRPAPQPSSTPMPTGEVQPAGGEGKLSGSQIKELAASFGQFAGELRDPAQQVEANFMPAVEEAFAKSEGVTIDGLIEKLGSLWSSIEAAIHGVAADFAAKVVNFFVGEQAEGEIGETIGWLTGTIAFEIILGVLTAGTWTAASPIMRAVQKFAKLLDWTGEVIGVVFKGLGKLGGLIFKGKGALSKLLEKAGAAAAKVIEPLEQIAKKILNWADEMLGRFGGKAAREAGEEVGEAGAKKLGGEAAEEAGEEAAEQGAEAGGKQAGEEAGEEAGQQGGKQAGEEAGEEAGQQGGKQAGEEAGEEAGQQGGKQAGEEAGQQGGKQAGEEAAEELPVPAGPAPGRQTPPPPDAPKPKPSAADDFSQAVAGGGADAVAKGRALLDEAGDIRALRDRVKAGEFGDPAKAAKALDEARSQAIKEAQEQVSQRVGQNHPGITLEYTAPGTPKFGSDVDVTAVAKCEKRVQLEGLSGRGPMSPEDARKALDDMGIPPGPERQELEQLLQSGQLKPGDAGKYLSPEDIKREIAASVEASDEFYKLLGNPDKKFDANFYSDLKVDDLTRKASPAEQAKVLHEQSAVSMAEMRRNMGHDEWASYKQSQLEAVDQLGDDAASARIRQQLEEAERIAKDLEGKTLEQAKKELQDVLSNPNASLSEVREAMAKVKLLEPDAYGTHAAVKDVVDHLQTASRQSDQIKNAIDEAYLREGIAPSRLNDPKYRAEVEDKLMKIDKEIKERFADQLDEMGALGSKAHGLEPGSPEHLAFLGQEASANMGKLYHATDPSAQAKYLERINYATREAGMAASGEITDRELRAMIAAKGNSAAQDAVLREWAERTGRTDLLNDPAALRKAWEEQTRKAAQDAVLDIRTAEQLEFQMKQGADGGTPSGPSGGGAADEAGAAANQTGKQAGEEAAEETGEAAGKQTDELDDLEGPGGETPPIPDQNAWKTLNTSDFTPDEAKLFDAVQKADEVLIGRGINIREQPGMFTFDEWLNANGIPWSQRWQDVYNKAVFERTAGGKPVNVLSGRDYTAAEAAAAEAGAASSGVVNKPYWPDSVGQPPTPTPDVPTSGATGEALEEAGEAAAEQTGKQTAEEAVEEATEQAAEQTGKETAEEASEQTTEAAAKEQLLTELEAVGLPRSYTENLTPEQLTEVKQALDKWNLDAGGKNQGITHTLDYAAGAGGASKANRLQKLEEYTGKGPFDVTDPQLLPKVSDTLDEIIAGAAESKKVGDKTIYFIPKGTPATPMAKSQKGMIVITYQGRYATFFNTDYKSFGKMA